MRNDPVEIRSRDHWFKIVEFLQQNWALLDDNPDGSCTIHFVDDASGVFDRLTYPTREEAEGRLGWNGFERFANDAHARSFLRAPMPPFHERPYPIYSSGKFWS